MLARRICSFCKGHAHKRLELQTEKFYSSGSRKLTNAEVRKKRSALFEEEKMRQLEQLQRLEKVQVMYNGPPEDEPVRMVMNRFISTPYNCAMHINEFLMKRSIVALVDGVPWDMHRPFIGDQCSLELKHMLDEDPSLPNQVFWRTGSFVLGSIIDGAFKDDVSVELCDYPRTKVEHGCFLYDVDLKIPDWKPTQMELQCLSREGGRLWTKELDFEPLDVDGMTAVKMFEDNRHKTKLLKQLLENSKGGSITLYRMGDYVDFCKGPLISNTSQIHRFSITAVHQVESDMYGKVYRFQALALPIDLKMHWWSWEFLCRRAAKHNKTPINYIKHGTSGEFMSEHAKDYNASEKSTA